VKPCGQLSTGVWASSIASAKMFTFIEKEHHGKED
jgi:hypothetical protein